MLGYSERDVWHMTLRKLHKLFGAHMDWEIFIRTGKMPQDNLKEENIPIEKLLGF